MKENLSAPSVRLRAGAVHDGMVAITIEGRLDSNTTGKIWRQATETVVAAKGRSVIVDASEIDYCDGSGIALFVHLGNLQHKAGGSDRWVQTEARLVKGLSGHISWAPWRLE